MLKEDDKPFFSLYQPTEILTAYGVMLGDDTMRDVCLAERVTYSLYADWPPQSNGYQKFISHHPKIPDIYRTNHPCRPTLSQSLLPDRRLSNIRLPFLITFKLSTVCACTIIPIALSSISHTNIPNLVPNLHPSLTAGRNWTNLAQDPVRQARDEETGEEVDIVDVFRTLRHRLSNGSNESDDVDEDTAYIGCISAPMESKSEVVGCRFAGGVEVRYLVVTAAHDVVIADDDASDRG